MEAAVVGRKESEGCGTYSLPSQKKVVILHAVINDC
jgi:hypothetical protein